VFVFISHLTVPPEDHGELERHFRERSGLVDDFDMPELMDRYGAVGRERCLEDIRYTIDHLIPAVDFAQPSMFASYVGWLAELLRARNVSTREVFRSLEIMEQAVRNELAADEADVVASCIRAGLDSLGGVWRAG
jgi:hypothetical protein